MASGAAPSPLGVLPSTLSSTARSRRSAETRSAYAGLDRVDALSLADKTFPALVGRSAWRGLDLAPGEAVVRYLSSTTALVKTRSGRRGVVVGNAPLVGTSPGGARVPVDLSLQAVGGGSFAPVSSDVPLSLPGNASGAIHLPQQGVGIEFDGAASTAADPRAAELAYASAYHDTDAFAAVVPSGLEISYQLRSADAPQELKLDLTAQPGDVVRLVEAHDPLGGAAGSAEIDRRGKPVLAVAPAVATDAAGQAVPVNYSIENGSTLTLRVQTGSSTVWPVMVDPTVEVAGVAATSGAGCNPNPTSVGWLYGGSGNFFDAEDFNCNLYLYGGNSNVYSAYSYYEWAHLSPAPAAYIYRLDEYNVSHVDYPQTTSTTFLAGLVASTGPSLAGYTLLSYGTKISDVPLTYTSNQFAGQILTFCTGAWSATVRCQPGPQNAPGDVGFFELYANGNGTESGQPKVGVGAETLYSSDDVQPTLTVTAPTGGQTVWLRNGSSGSVTFAAKDQTGGGALGLGIASVGLSGPGIAAGGSAGLTATNPCSPTYGGCATTQTDPYTATISYKTTDSTPEGTPTLTLTTTSVSGITIDTPITVAVDATAPSIGVGGAMTAPFVGDTSTDLDVSATDSAGSRLTSGVASVEVLIDGSDPGGQYLYRAGACPAGSCDAEHDFTIATSSLAAGAHTATVLTRDFAGNQGSMDVPFVVSRTAPTVALTGPAATDGAWVGPGPATVNLSASEPASGSGLATATLTVDGGWSSSLQSDCEGDVEDSTCGLTGTVDLGAAGLTDGPHQAQLAVLDNAGNTTTNTWTVNMDSTRPQIDTTGSLADAKNSPTPTGTYTLHVTAADPGTAASGITDASVFVDGKSVASQHQACPGGGCSLTLDYTYVPASFSSAAHTIEVYAADAAGNVDLTSWDVNPQPTQPILTGSCRSTASAQPAPAGANPLSVSAVLDLLTQAVPSVVADTVSWLLNGTLLTPVLRSVTGGMSGDDQLSPSWVASTAAGAVAVGSQADPICLTPTVVDAQASVPSPAGNAASVVANFEPDTDEVTRAATFGLESVLNIRSNVAPQSFAWTVTLASGDSLQQLAPNVVAVVRPDASDASAPATSGPPDDGSPQPGSDAAAAARAGDTSFPSPPMLTFPASDPLPTPDTPAPGSAVYPVSAANSAAAQGGEAAAELNSANERVSGDVRAVIVVPAATDASGHAVPAAVTAQGNTVTIVVPHSAATSYPVTVVPVFAAPTASTAALSSTTSKQVPAVWKQGPCYGALPVPGYIGGVELGRSAVFLACTLDRGDVLSQPRQCIRMNQSGTSKYEDFHDWACVSTTVPDSVGQPLTFPALTTVCAPGIRTYAMRVTFSIHVGGVIPKDNTYRLQGPSRVVDCAASALWQYTANLAGPPSGVLRRNLDIGPDPLPKLADNKTPFPGFVAHHMVPTNDGRTDAAIDARARGWMCAIGGVAPAPQDLIVPGGLPDPNAAVNGVFTRGYRLAKAGDSAYRPGTTQLYTTLANLDRARGTDYHSRQYDHTLHTPNYYAAVAAALATVPNCTFPLNPGGSYRRAAEMALDTLVRRPILAGNMVH